jgi:hypothetical protein
MNFSFLAGLLLSSLPLASASGDEILKEVTSLKYRLEDCHYDLDNQKREHDAVVRELNVVIRKFQGQATKYKTRNAVLRLVLNDVNKMDNIADVRAAIADHLRPVKKDAGHRRELKRHESVKRGAIRPVIVTHIEPASPLVSDRRHRLRRQDRIIHAV